MTTTTTTTTTTKPRTCRYFGTTTHGVHFDGGTWVEDEALAYPSGGFTRRARVLMADDANVMRFHEDAPLPEASQANAPCPCGAPEHVAVDIYFDVYEDDGKWDSGKRWFQRPLPFPPGERVTYVGVCGYWHEELLQREIKRNPGKVVIG